jgi:hypothetical protein
MKLVTRVIDAATGLLKRQPAPYFRSAEDASRALALPVLATCPARKDR